MTKIKMELSDAEYTALVAKHTRGRLATAVLPTELAATAKEILLRSLGTPCPDCGVPREVSLDASFADEDGQWRSSFQENARLLRCAHCSGRGGNNRIWLESLEDGETLGYREEVYVLTPVRVETSKA